MQGVGAGYIYCGNGERGIDSPNDITVTRESDSNGAIFIP
jgi:hypothetical protein